MLEKGILGKSETIVTEADTAKAMGSGELSVYATPAMIALMEETAYKSVTSMLEEGMGSVGTSIEVKHISASPTGMKITCESELLEVDGRRLVFRVTAFDETGKIGEGLHERFLIDKKSFQNKADRKCDGSKGGQ